MFPSIKPTTKLDHGDTVPLARDNIAESTMIGRACVSVYPEDLQHSKSLFVRQRMIVWA